MPPKLAPPSAASSRALRRGDGEAKINLAAADDMPELLSAVGMTRADIRRAMRIVKEQQAFLQEQWSEIHG